MINFNQFIEWAFLGILSGGVMVGVKILFDMKESIGSLNNKIAVILERITYHEKEIEKNSVRIKELENGRFK